MIIFHRLVLIAGVALIAGCGGSGSCGGKLAFGTLAPASCEGGSTNTLTGRFLDSAVEGLEYETATQKGKTNANGEFKYLEGEIVTFKIYGVPIGAISGTPIVTPVSIAPITGATDFSLNVLRFLQSVDSDNNLNNGIKLPGSLPIPMPNFNQSSAAFAAVMATTPITLVSEVEAWQHFRNTLNQITADDSYTFNIAGKLARAYPFGCKNTFIAFELSFSNTGGTFVSGTDLAKRDNDGVCSGFPTPDEDVGIEFSYADFKRDGFLIPCNGSVCSLNQLNNVYQGTDSDGRTWIQVISHVKNSNQITSSKYIIRNGEKICIHKYLVKFE